MAANMRFVGVFVSFIMLKSCNCQVNSTTVSTEAPATTTEAPISNLPSSVALNTDLAQCTCDLTANGCDVNCCCDADCTADDRLAFSQCIDEFNVVDTQACIRSNLVFRENTPYIVNTSVAGIFCVQFDNYESRNFFTAPDILNTTEKVDEYKTTYGQSYSFQKEAQETEINTDYYRSGDPIYTVYQSNALGQLGFPVPLMSQFCTDNNPAGYLIDQHVECVRDLVDLATDCETNPALNAQIYYSDFSVITSPKAFDTGDNSTDSGNGNSTASPTEEPTSLFNSSLVTSIIPLGPHICIDSEGFNTTCPFGDTPPSPSLGTGTCDNAVVKVAYSFTYNGTEGITAVSVTFTFRNLTDSLLPLTQGFEIGFMKGDDNSTFQRSGNPGYKVEEPLLAGFLAERTNDDGTQILGIELDTNRDNWVTMVTSAANGDCVSEIDNRVSVTFGVGMRSGCFVLVYFSNMTSACGQIQQAAWNALRGPRPPQYVATFGNTPVEQVGDWVEIFGVNEEPPTPTSSQTPGICRNIITGLHIEFIYAEVGSLANPQAKIIGASYIYHTQDEVRYQCVGPSCMPGNEATAQRIEIVSSVGFIDASQKAIPVSAERPKVTARLPEDFFYPFS